MKGFKEELTNNILPYWINRLPDYRNGGFYGRIDGNDILHPLANKGAILNTRILWTFSAAYRVLGSEEYLAMAERAFDYITKHFLDPEYGGIYWELDCKGKPVNTKKQLYVQGFAIYGLSEFYRAFGDERALAMAKDIFRLVEKCRDNEHGGYPEAFTREWKPLDDMRLSQKDLNEAKSANTHLHLLEPYTNLMRIWNNEKLILSHRELIDIFTDKIINKDSWHLGLFFDNSWNPKSDVISYGHDIEASWLLYEAAKVNGNAGLIKKITDISLKIADAATEGINPDGSMAYEKNGPKTDTERHWWVQAEAVTGYMYAYENSGDIKYKLLAEKAWRYIQANLIDRENGEWYWSRRSDGTINRLDDKAGFWKCPYHNGRLCLEMIENFGLN